LLYGLHGPIELYYASRGTLDMTAPSQRRHDHEQRRDATSLVRIVVRRMQRVPRDERPRDAEERVSRLLSSVP
jgi:hypothetical protein